MYEQTTVGYADKNEKYWNDYSSLQHAKHDLIRHYPGGWFPKLGSWAGRVVYVDTHAGRGRHASGEFGSPLVALDTLLKHPHRGRLLYRSEFVFSFIERDKKNLDSLNNEIAALGPLPNSIRIELQAGDGLAVLQNVLESLREQNSQMAPAFIFLDPYGFKLPGSLMRDLMNAGRVELLITFMWRWVDMAIAQTRNSSPSGTQLAKSLDALFDSGAWRTRITSDHSVGRSKQAAELLRERIDAKWFTGIWMLGENDAIRYLLLHFTKHPDGRDLMKDCIWKICPDSDLYVRKGDHPNQEFLIKPTPDLRPLSSLIHDLISKNACRWSELDDRLSVEIWRKSHLRKVLKQLLEENRITCDGPFSRQANPIFHVR